MVVVGAYNAREDIIILYVTSAVRIKGKRQLAKPGSRLIRRIFNESNVLLKAGLVWFNMRSSGWIFFMALFHERRRISWSVEQLSVFQGKKLRSMVVVIFLT
jgi:hypothetical protein